MGNIEPEDIDPSIDLIANHIERLNAFLQPIFITDDPLCFVYKFVTFLEELKQTNHLVFSQFCLKASIFMMEDLKIKMQKKNYRYNKLYKLESRDVMKF